MAVQRNTLQLVTLFGELFVHTRAAQMGHLNIPESSPPLCRFQQETVDCVISRLGWSSASLCSEMNCDAKCGTFEVIPGFNLNLRVDDR